jgi:hypothetical protein
VIPVVTGAKSFTKYLNNVPGKHETATLVTAHTQTAGSADVKVQNIFHGRNNITCSTHCKYRTAATLYAVETWFVSGT